MRIFRGTPEIQNKKRKMNSKLTSILLAATFAVSPLLHAQDKATLDLLVAKGVITRAEADGVSKKAVQVSAKEKTTKSIKISGRLQMQYENINVDETIAGVERSLVSQNNFLMRRIFLGMNADLGAGWSTEIVTDFMSDKTNYIDKATVTKKVDWDYLQGKLAFGFQKINFGLEENTSSSKLVTIERSLATRYFTEPASSTTMGIGARHVGVFWSGKIPQVNGLEYSLSLTNSYNNNAGKALNNANDLMYAAGVSYKTNIDKAAIKVGSNFVYTNGLDVNNGGKHRDAVGVNPYITFAWSGLSVQSDFLLASVQDGGMGNTQNSTPMGVNVSAEYRFDIGELGQIAPVVRYSWLDTDGRGIKMGDAVRRSNSGQTYNAGQSVYIGANWYVIGDSLKFQVGYEWAQLNDNIAQTVAQHSEANAVRAQIQVLF